MLKKIFPILSGSIFVFVSVWLSLCCRQHTPAPRGRPFIVADVKINMKCCFLAVLVLLSLDVARGALLVGNTRGDFEITLLQEDNETATVLDGMDGLEAPDHVLWDGTYYYISTGTTNATSSIARYTVETGEFELVWATGGPLMRPYGFASDGDVLYVASFMSDQILMYDGESGSYMGVFAQGDATEEGLCNGPNQSE
jgi:hypothetical protein